MKATKFPEANLIMKAPEGQEDKVSDLPVWRGKIQDQWVVMSCWEATDAELEAINQNRKVWMLHFGTTMPPSLVTGLDPFESPIDDGLTAGEMREKAIRIAGVALGVLKVMDSRNEQETTTIAMGCTAIALVRSLIGEWAISPTEIPEGCRDFVYQTLASFQEM